MVKSTFLENDVKILLKDIGDSAIPLSQEEREELIKTGTRAYELLALEETPSQEDFYLYEKGLQISTDDTARAVRNVAEQIYRIKRDSLVLISLARGGIPAGVLIKKYLEQKYKIEIPHYAVTLIGTKGIDVNALRYVLKRHSVSSIQFVDGWTGKGAIVDALKQALIGYDGLSSDLAVLSDPANLAGICGTHDDILIASACLNSATAGLLSRAVYSRKFLSEDDFYGAIFYNDLIEMDKTYDFITKIEKKFDYSDNFVYELFSEEINGLEEVKKIVSVYDISGIHFVKPGVGETMRALIRKTPDFILIKDENNKYIEYILELANRKGIPVEKYPLQRYNVCAIFKDKNSDIL